MPPTPTLPTVSGAKWRATHQHSIDAVLGAAQAQYNLRVAQTCDDMARVELVMLDPATLTERLLQQDDLNL